MFGGSAAVLINRAPAPVETYNDLDSELVNFFTTLRHPERGERLLKEIALTPFSREELALACTPEIDLDNVERARRFYVRARQTRTGPGADFIGRPLGPVHTDLPLRNGRRRISLAGGHRGLAAYHRPLDAGCRLTTLPRWK